MLHDICAIPGHRESFQFGAVALDSLKDADVIIPNGDIT